MGHPSWFKIIFSLELLVLVFVVGSGLYNNYTFERTVQGEVVAITYVEGPWEHTTIYFKTLSETEITRTFEGRIGIQIGGIYQITYNKPYWHAYYNIIELKEVQSLGGTQ